MKELKKLTFKESLSRTEMKMIMAGSDGGEECNQLTCTIDGCRDEGERLDWCEPSDPGHINECLGGTCNG